MLQYCIIAIAALSLLRDPSGDRLFMIPIHLIEAIQPVRQCCTVPPIWVEMLQM